MIYLQWSLDSKSTILFVFSDFWGGGPPKVRWKEKPTHFELCSEIISKSGRNNGITVQVD